MCDKHEHTDENKSTDIKIDIKIDDKTREWANIDKIVGNDYATMPISEIIRKRVRDCSRSDYSITANSNIATFLEPGDLDLLEKEVENAVQQLLKSLVIDVETDHNTKDTAHRIAKMYIREIFSGRYTAPPKITTFPNVRSYDQLYITGPIPIRSVCAHHFQNIVGNCWIGVFPGSEVMGLSKFNRIVDYFASRPQIQEELTADIANNIQTITKATGVAVVIKAEHHCMLARGVKAHESDMTTSVLLGKLRTEPLLRQEFFTLLNTMKGMKS